MITGNSKKFAIDVSWAFVSSIIIIPLSFILRIFLARWLGAADIGLYQMVVTIFGMSSIAAAFGIPTAIIKFTAQSQDEQENLNRFATTSFAGSIVFGAVVGLLIYSLSGMLSRIFHMSELAHLLKILAFIFPFSSVYQTAIGLLNGMRKMRRYAIMIAIQSITMILFTIFIVSLGFGLNGAVYALVASMACSCIAAIGASRQFFRIDISSIREKSFELLRYGSLLLGSDVMNVMASSADIILIGYFLTKTDVGFYSIALTLSSIFTIIPAAIQKITYPATSEIVKKQQHRQYDAMLDKSMKYTSMVLIPIGLAVGFFSGPIINLLFGELFLASVLPLNILIVGRVTRGCINAPIGGLYTSIGRPDIALFLDSFYSITNILIMLFLIPAFGIAGAALSSTTSMVLSSLLFSALMPRLAHFRIDAQWYGRITVMALLSALIFLTSSMYLNKYVIGTLILLLFVYWTRRYFLTPDDRLFFNSYAMAVRNRFLCK